MKGSRPTKRYVLSKFKKIHVFGALGKNVCTTKLSPKINAKKFLPFLKRLKKHHKKLCIVIDNARWHLTKAVYKFVKQEGIVMIRLPPYSPELNPIEQYWKNIKQHLATKPVFNKEDLMRGLKNALQRNCLMLKSNYY